MSLKERFESCKIYVGLQEDNDNNNQYTCIKVKWSDRWFEM